MKASLVLSAALLFSGAASAVPLEQDVTQYAQLFSSVSNYKVETIESLAWMGLSDKRVFDPVVHHLLDDTDRTAILNEKNGQDIYAHYIRALGFSGQPEYAGTINKFLDDSHFSRQAKMALDDLALYQKWNPIISNRATFDPQYGDDVNRVLNMLHSSDFSLKRLGAKRVYFANQDGVLLDALATEIEASYMKADSSNEDQIAWMVKALGNAKNPKYKPFLEEVANNAKNGDVIKYAKRALEVGYNEWAPRSH